jgi:ABC-type amino acid transport substrate-binding protein
MSNNNKPSSSILENEIRIFLVLFGICVLVLLGVVTGIIDPAGASSTIGPSTTLPPNPPQPTATPIPDFSSRTSAITSLNGYTLTIAHSIESSPFASGSANPQGYEIEILNTIAQSWIQDYGLAGIKFVPIVVGGLDNALLGSNDIVARAISNQPERCFGGTAIGLCTTPTHFRDNYGLITTNTGLPEVFDNVDQFCEEYGNQEINVAVLPGTPIIGDLPTLEKVCSRPPTYITRTYSTRSAAIEAVKEGEVDVYMTDYEVLKPAISSDPTLRAVELKFFNERPEGYTFMLPFRNVQGIGYEGLWVLFNEELEKLDFAPICAKYDLPEEKCS